LDFKVFRVPFHVLRYVTIAAVAGLVRHPLPGKHALHPHADRGEAGGGDEEGSISVFFFGRKRSKKNFIRLLDGKNRLNE